ncbi:MAG: WecB/TagA/CpsF family glycosyltransferase [Dethiobacteria bacterium]
MYLSGQHNNRLAFPKRASILGRPIDCLTMDQAIQIICKALQEATFFHVVTANAEMLYNSRQDKILAKIIDSAGMVTADGAGVVIASRILACPVPERVAGYDLMLKCLQVAAHGNIPVYFLGSRPDVLTLAVSNALKIYPGLKVVGSHHGYFGEKDEPLIIKEINLLQPGLLLVAMGVPKQEKWIHFYKEKLPPCVAIGVGGSFDVLAGKVRRAPLWMQQSGLEWLYRVIKEPSRFKRAAVLPLFMIQVFWEALVKVMKRC